MLVIEKENMIQLAKDEYNQWRSEGHSKNTLCHAPFVSLDVRKSGAVHTCTYSEMPIGSVGRQTLESIWNGQELRDVRRRFRKYHVKVEECGGCVKHWKEGLPNKSPALAEFDTIKLARWGSPSVPQVLRLDLRMPLSPLDTKTVFRWFPRLVRLDLIVSWPLPSDSPGWNFIDHASTLPHRKRPKITLQVYDTIPEANQIRDGIAVVHLSLAMDEETLTSEQEESLEKLARSLKARGAELVIEVSVHQANWIHLRAWHRRTQGFGITLVPFLVPPSEKASLAHLDGDMLACLHYIFWKWFSEPSPYSLQEAISPTVEAMQDQLRRWQHDAAERPPQRSGLSFPNCHHAVVQDEAALEPFLAGLLRIYRDPSIERWLMDLIESEWFVTEARHRRSFRLAALWLACVFERAEALVSLEGILRDPHSARQLIDEDRNALIGTSWEQWFDSWSEQLNLKSLEPRTTQFPVGPSQHHLSKEPATITVIIAAYNQQAYIGETIRSVLAQTRTDFRLLVVDDASQDGTVEEVQNIKDSRLTIIRNPENLRQGQSLARALEHVDTEFVAFLDGDDLFHPRRLERCLSLLEKTPQAAVAATGLAVIDDKSRVFSTANSSPVFDGSKNFHWVQWYEGQASLPQTPEDILGDLLKRNFLITCSNLIGRTNFLRRHQEQWKRYQSCIDWQIYLAAALEHALCYVPDALLGYRLHQSNQSHGFSEKTNWRYYLEVNQVVARTVNHLFEQSPESDQGRLTSVLTAMTDHLNENTTLDWSGVVLGLLLERWGVAACDLNDDVVGKPIQFLMQARHHGTDFREYLCNRGDIPFLRALRNMHEPLQNRHERLKGEVAGLLFTRANAKPWWRKAELEQDQDQAFLELPVPYQEIRELGGEKEDLHAQLVQRTAERDELLNSFERRVGEYLLNRLHLRSLFRMAEWMKVNIQRHVTLSGLYLARWFSAWRRGHPRVLTTVCGNFPLYAQTFAHQELSQLVNHGFQLRLVYSFLESKENLHGHFDSLWKSKCGLSWNPGNPKQDFDRYRSRFLEKVEHLVHRLCDASGLTEENLLRNQSFLQAFSFTRMAEAYRPHYLHSYFFYDRSLMALVAGYLLDIPRGISCYADHVLKDYELKVVPLHLELCDVVIATSERIKSELLDLAPATDPNRILVKPNAIDTQCFPVTGRREPEAGNPFRLVCVSRIEPKKGLLYLVEAVHLLRQRGLQMVLHLVGMEDRWIQSSEDYKRQLDDRISKLNLREIVRLEGRQHQEGVLRFLHMSHLFVAPFIETESGDKDGIPTALLEAMATGLPALATDAGSISEVIDDGQDGVLVPQRDSLALANAIESLLRNPDLRNVLGENAAKKVSRQFDVRGCEHIFHERVRSVLQARV